MKTIQALFDSQHCFFSTGETLSLKWRITQLKKLRSMILEKTDIFLHALKKDLGRPPQESYNAEIALLLVEIDHALKKLHHWTTPHRVHTPLATAFSKGVYRFTPFGSVLIIGAWNYPILLLLQPLISALAAGNCCVLKPSEIARETKTTLIQSVKSCFDEKDVACIDGGADETIAAIRYGKPDMVFFTGSTSVGRSIMKQCSEHLIPVVLELGGCCPCIVEPDCDIKTAARRILWGKYFNAGQTCISVNCCFIHRSIKEKFTNELKSGIAKFYGHAPQNSPHYGRIINDKHFERLHTLYQEEGGVLIAGGEFRKDDLYISPTIVEIENINSRYITEEIFGPIMPIVTYDNLDELLVQIRKLPSPLVVYLFARNKATVKNVCRRTVSGNFCVNSTLDMMTCSELPFGGVGDSGMGRYHGYTGFETFSYKRAEYQKSIFPDLKIIYPPYKLPLKLIRMLILPFLKNYL